MAKPIAKILKPLEDIDHEEIEKEILDFFKREIYLPILKELKIKQKLIKNERVSPLAFAIQSNTVHYADGKFMGSFNAAITKELNTFKKNGGKWKGGEFHIPITSLPLEIRSSISLAKASFLDTLNKIDQKLAQALPVYLIDKLKLAQLFSKEIWKLNDTFVESVKAISIPTVLSPTVVDESARDHATNLKFTIKGWTDNQIEELRKKIKDTYQAGNRYESLIKVIMRDYRVSKNKAKFLARQETGLLSSKFREMRYRDAGIEYYIWTSVLGTSKHPVRDLHKHLDGKICRWDDPPISGTKGEKQHPREPFGCRCMARPVIFPIPEELAHRPNKNKFGYNPNE